MKNYQINLTQEQKDELATMSIATAEVLCEVLGVRVVVSNGKVEGLEL